MTPLAFLLAAFALTLLYIGAPVTRAVDHILPGAMVRLALAFFIGGN